MRSKKVLVNSIFGIGGYAILMLSNFITRAVFVAELGFSMGGVDTTFKNFLQVLSLAELGLSTGLLYKLYKPIEDKDNAAIKRVLNFYKQAYKVIASVFMGGALILSFAVNFVIKDTDKPKWYISLLFILYAADTVASYLYANRKALIVADQNNYVVNRNDAFVSVITLISQVILLKVTHSFVIYAVVKIVCRLIGAVSIGYQFKKRYPEIAADKSKDTITGDERKSLTKNMGAMLCHRVGGVSVTATGSAIITYFIGTAVAGVYGNYTLITNALNQLVTQVFNGITASFGNIITVETKETVYKRFKLLYFFNYLIFSFFTVSFGVLVQPFMRLWMQDKEGSMFPTTTLLLLVVYFYVYGMRRVVLMSKDSAGLYRQDCGFAILEAVINIVLSIALAWKFKSINGIIAANVLSMLIIPMWTQPYLVYKYVLKHKLTPYYLTYILYTAITAASFAVTWILAEKATSFTNNLLVELFIRVVICVIVPNLINLLVFIRTDEMKDLITLLLGVLKKKTAVEGGKENA
ncbi:MAG: hypothetical protein K2G60_05395 [Oscillospiraceae bacterium]|nr:hypothetical protein [Oscillospiraceae bacterium]